MASLLQTSKALVDCILSGDFDCARAVPESAAQTDEERAFLHSLNQLLEKQIEGHRFLHKVSTGELSAEPPANNYLMGATKQLHANLRHLLWQLERLSVGDLNQRVSYLGDFSQTFNQLIESLREKKYLQDQAYRNEEFYRKLLSVSPDGITVADVNGIQTLVSEKGVAMFGYHSAEEMLGKHFLDFVAQEFREKATFLLQELLEGHYHGVGDYQVVRRDGGLFWVEANAEVLRKADGEAEAIMFVYRDITLRKLMEQQLVEYSVLIEQQARVDRMTGMFNRSEGIRQLKNHLMRGATGGFPVSICFIDMDDLKYINDQFGHEEGDRMILSLASCFTSSIRDSDCVARLGGDEFLLIFPGCASFEVNWVIARVQANVDRINQSKLHKTQLSFSYGIASSDADHSTSHDTLIRLADERMYLNKRGKKMARNKEAGVVTDENSLKE